MKLQKLPSEPRLTQASKGPRKDEGIQKGHVKPSGCKPGKKKETREFQDNSKLTHSSSEISNPFVSFSCFGGHLKTRNMSMVAVFGRIRWILNGPAPSVVVWDQVGPCGFSMSDFAEHDFSAVRTRDFFDEAIKKETQRGLGEQRWWQGRTCEM